LPFLGMKGRIFPFNFQGDLQAESLPLELLQGLVATVKKRVLKRDETRIGEGELGRDLSSEMKSLGSSGWGCWK